MISSQRELERLLKDDGKMIKYSSSKPKCYLSKVLADVKVHLQKVNQRPIKSTQNALQPLMSALTTEGLIKHSDKYVRISVASCISEILRITAPALPYSNENRKEIFKLIMTAFDELSQVSNISFTEVVSILEIFSSVGFFVAIMDLECDALIIEMFQLFLNIIRSDHPHAVFSSMEKIMTSILEESEEISAELLGTLLNGVRNENQNVSPLSFKLGEKVLTNCVDKLNPGLLQAVVSLGIDLKNYTEIVTSICQNASQTLKRYYVGHSGDILASEILHEQLVGCEIHVWWPKNKRFNEGVIDDFDPVRKKLKVLYHEGDEEILNLSKERWKLVKNGKSIDPQTPDASSNLHVHPAVAKMISWYTTNGPCSQDVKEEKPESQFTPSTTSRENGQELLGWQTYVSKRRSHRHIKNRFQVEPSTESTLVEVGGHRVKASTAPTLETIFAKYGDIAVHCLYNSASVRASLLEVICDIVHRLQNNDISHVVSELQVVENEVSDAEAAKMEVSWLREHLEKIHEVKEVGQRSLLLKGSKANSIFIIKAATKELGERHLELVAAQERFRETEKCVNAMKIVSKKIDDDILELEAEEYFWRRRLNGLL